MAFDRDSLGITFEDRFELEHCDQDISAVKSKKAMRVTASLTLP